MDSSTYNLQKAAILLLLTLGSIFIFINKGHAQMEAKDVASPPYDPQSLIINELLGEGVRILDVTYEGENSSVGFFSNAQNSVGIQSGVILTTGSVSTIGAAIGVDQVGSVEASVDNGSIVQDADMTTLADNSLFNISKYTITFIPSSDSIRFRYVFASEEYPEFVCSDYNDIFGFFISGPGLNGPYENNAENIALIPGTDLPVKINNVNGGVVGSQGIASNCANGNGYLNFDQFYQNNDGSNNQPVFDGFTQVFTASAKVIPCETYVIKLVVADQGDPQRDSGVFLEAKSFSSSSISINVLTNSIDGTIVEGCTDAELVINIPEPLASDYILDVNVFGQANEGADFAPIPAVTIPAGQTSVIIPINAQEDNIEEGLEEIFFDVQLNQCFRDTFSLFITDNQIPIPDLGEDISGCAGISAELDANINTTTVEPIVFNSSDTNVPIISPRPGSVPSEIKASLEVIGIQPLSLRPDLIQSVCIDVEHGRLEDLAIYLEAPNGQLLALTTGNGGTDDNYTNTCFVPSGAGSIRDGAAPFTGDFLPEGDWANLWASDAPTNGTWNLVIIDEAFGFNGLINSWSITFNPILEYTYSWTPTEGLSCSDCPNPTATPDASTDYILTFLDNYGCSSTDTFSITIFDDLDTQPTINCLNQTPTSLSIGWDEIPEALSYEININNAGWDAIDSLTYTLDNLSLNETVEFQVRAIGGCNNTEASMSCTTLDCTEIVLDQEDVGKVSCNGGNDGFINISVTGDAPFNFELSTGATNTTGLFPDLAVGDYQIVVTDALDCTNTFDFSISEPTALEVTPVEINPLGCEGEEASATVTISGGTTPYSFEWSNSQTDSILTTASDGEFTVTISDANNCTTTSSVSIAAYTPMEVSTDSVATCEGETMGSATITVIGGTTPLSYQWDAAAASQTTATASDLAAGTYNVTVTDANDCIIEAQATVEEIPALLEPQVTCGNITNSSITFVWTNDPNAQSFEVNVDGAGWTTPSEDLSHTINDLTLGQTVELEVRPVGDCDGLVGAMSCTTLDCTEIVLEEQSSTNITCNGDNDGTISISVTGDNAPFTYDLQSTGDSNDTGIFTDLAAGEYIILVTDALNCTNAFNFTLTEPSALEATSSIINPLGCDGEAANATVEVVGGTAPYTFAWSDSQTDSILMTTESGAFTVTITDANNCTTTSMLTIEEITPLEINIDSLATCTGENQGTATVMITGGSEPYEIQWDAAAGDQTTATASDLAAGIYGVIITDASGCSIEGSTTIDETLAPVMPEVSCSNTTGTSITFVWTNDPNAQGFEINIDGAGWIEPSDDLSHTVNGLTLGQAVEIEVRGIGACSPPIGTVSCTTMDCSIIDISSDVTNIFCFGETTGSATFSATGENAPFTYSFNDVTNEDGVFTDLPAGDYTINVTDALGCNASLPITIEQPEELVATASLIREESCDQTALGAIITEGGTAPLDIAWSTGENSDTLILEGGSYTISVTDSNGCTQEASLDVPEYTPLSATTDGVDDDCGETPSGEASITVTGGVPDYEYLWNDPAAQTTPTANNLTAGSYEVTITDAQSCTLTEIIEISSPSAISIDSFMTTAVSCAGGMDGEAVAIISGGNGETSYLWDDGQTTENASNLSPGSHSLEVTDELGCVTSAAFFIEEPEGMELSATKTDIDCAANANGSIDLSVSGGADDYTFAWSNEDTTEDINNLPAGAYTVQVTDANGCTEDFTETIVAPDSLRLTLQTTNISCNQSVGEITTSIEGGTAPYNYTWSNGEDTPNLTDLEPGTYSLAVTDANDCPVGQETTITSTDGIEASLNSIPPVCADGPGAVQVSIIGSATPYEISIDGRSVKTDSLYENLSVGEHRIEITDANGCVFNEVAMIPNVPALEVSLDNSLKIQLGDSLTLEPQMTGGTAPYLFEWTDIPANSLSCDDCSITTARPFMTTSYEVNITDVNGCQATATTRILVNRDKILYVPNAFSPNADGVNDRLVVFGRANTRVLDFQIYDRWGNRVYVGENFEVNDFTTGWDGTYNREPMDNAVFLWYARIELGNGDSELCSGEVTLLR